MKLKLKILILLVMLNSFQHLQLNAQDRVMDSLKLALKNAKHDTTRCNILSAMVDSESDNIMLPKYNEQLKNLAEKNIANNTSPKKFYLKHLANSYNNWGFYYSNQFDITKAFEYYFRSLTIYKKIGDKEGVSITLNNISHEYLNQGNFIKALDYAKLTLILDEEIGNKINITATLGNIGYIYNSLGNIPSSLEYHFRSLKIKEQIGDKKGKAISLINIGNIYQSQGDYSKALELFQESLKINEEIGIQIGIAKSLNSMGNIYNYLGDKNKVIFCFNKSLKISELIGDKIGLAVSLNNFGTYYYNEEEYTNCIFYLKKSLIISEKTGRLASIALCLDNIARALIKSGHLGEAEIYASKGLSNAKEIKNPKQIGNSAQTLKQIFQKQNKYKEAFEMFELEIKMKDSINNQETQKAAIKKQMQYTYEKQEEVAKAEHKKELEKQQAVAEEKNRRQNIVIGSVAIGLLLVIIFAGYVFKTLRVTRKQKALIEIKNKETEHQKKEIEMKQKEILDSIRYAKRIQMAQIPSEKQVEKNLERLRKI